MRRTGRAGPARVGSCSTGKATVPSWEPVNRKSNALAKVVVVKHATLSSSDASPCFSSLWQASSRPAGISIAFGGLCCPPGAPTHRLAWVFSTDAIPRARHWAPLAPRIRGCSQNLISVGMRSQPGRAHTHTHSHTHTLTHRETCCMQVPRLSIAASVAAACSAQDIPCEVFVLLAAEEE